VNATAAQRTESSDASLVAACLEGDEAAWEALVRRYQRFVHDIPRRAGLDEDASADLFQEVFVTLLRSLGSLEDPERLSAWILTITKRATWRYVRRRIAAREHLAELDDAAEQAPDGAPLPEEVLLRLENQHEVRTAVSAIDERCRQLLTMLFSTQRPPSYGVIATTLGISEGSIGPIRARCLKRVERILNRGR
jgi:RNA polymerase sigma factor (sigma-70 family)